MLTNLDRRQLTSMLLQLIISNLQVMARQLEWVLLRFTWPKTWLNLQLTQELLRSTQTHNSPRAQSARVQIILQTESSRVEQSHTVQFTMECKEQQALAKVQPTVQLRTSEALLDQLQVQWLKTNRQLIRQAH